MKKGNDINKLSIEELQILKYKVDEELKAKKKEIKRKRTPKDSEKRKPTVRLRKNKYIELYQKNLEGKTVCKYIGKVGETSTEVKLEELTDSNPTILEEYQELLKRVK